MNPGDKEAEAKFKEATEAYSILSDPDKRRQYDQFGHAAFENGGGGGAGGFGGFDFSGSDMGDIFGDIFGDLFGGGGSRRRANNGPMKGANLRARVNITFEDAVFGCDKELEITLKDECTTCHGTGAKAGTSPVTCPKCNGEGQIVYTQQSMFGMVRNVQVCPDCHGSGKIIKDKCPDCRGTGYISNRKKIKVSIPAGIDNGQSIRIRDKGEPGTNGGPRGDLLVEVNVGRHPIFQRQDMNIYSTAPITYAQAALGGEVKLNTVDGEMLYEVKPGTQTDTRIRLKGKGVPSLRNKNVRGDHYVTLVVQVPTNLNEEAKVFIKGRVSEEDDAASKLICEQVIPFAQTRKELWLQYPDKETYLRQEGMLQDILKVSEGMDEVIIYCKKEKAVKRLPKGWNVTADEVLLSRLTNYLGESCVKVIEKPIESVH